MATTRWELIRPDGLNVGSGKDKAIRLAAKFSGDLPGRWTARGDQCQYVYEGGELVATERIGSTTAKLGTLGNALSDALTVDLAEAEAYTRSN